MLLKLTSCILLPPCKGHLALRKCDCKPLSATTNVVGLQTDDADHVGQNSSAHMARVVGLQTDAVIGTEPRLRFLSVTINSLDSKLAAAGHVGNNNSDQVASRSRSQTDAVRRY